MAKQGNRKGARARAAQRRNDALELRKAGASYRQIGQQLGVSHQQAHRDVTKAIRDLAKLGEGNARELRILEAERLDALFLSLWPQARVGDLQVVDRTLRIMARRAKLLGLDAPLHSQSQNLNIDVTQLTDEQLDRIANGENPVSVMANARQS